MKGVPQWLGFVCKKSDGLGWMVRVGDTNTAGPLEAGPLDFPIADELFWNMLGAGRPLG